MGLSIAGWALVWFVLFGVLGVFLCVLVQKRARASGLPATGR
jgi:hypothetical protein